MGEHEYQHLVPQTYLHAWSKNGTNVCQLDKDKTLVKPARIDNNFGIKHEYSIVPGLLHLSDAQCDTFFQMMEGYTVTHDGTTLDSPELLNRFFPFYAEWTILDTDGNPLGKKRKVTLRQATTKQKDFILETGHIKHYEDKWPKMRDELTSRAFQSSKKTIDEFNRGFFIRYMVIQHWRGFGHSAAENRAFEFIDSIIPFSETDIPREQRMYVGSINLEEDLRHEIRLNYLQRFFNNEGPIYNQSQWLLQNSTLGIYLASGSYSFLSSDTPCFAYRDSTVQLVFPITPRVLIALQPRTKSCSYPVIRLNDADVRKINDTIFLSAKRYLISRNKSDFYCCSRLAKELLAK